MALSRIPLTLYLRDSSPFVTAAPSMIIAAFFGGLWPTLAVGLIGLWVGEAAMTSAGGPGLSFGGVLIYIGFALVFAVAGEMRQRGIRRAAADADRLADMQRRLGQVSRLNAMGEMAGALAHELNQPLTAISSYAGAAEWLIRDRSDEAPELADILRKISEQALRAREIISRIRAHISGGTIRLEPCGLSALFHDALVMATAGEIDAGLKVRYEFDETAQQVMADRLQIQQVLVNLIRNATEAMRGRPRRRIRLGARTGDGGMVEAYVADSGPGLAPEVADHLFEPFVTGKSEGMGIGLAIARNIVEAHGGRIWADGNEDRGATFHFTLRAAPAEARA